MATKTQIRAEDYLRMTFEHDAEFAHGEIVERSMPDKLHAWIQSLIVLRFGSLIQTHSLYPLTEVRVKVAVNTYRIPDVTIFAGALPEESVPETAPLVVVEILSKDDRQFDLMQKLEEYRVWGVPYIWVIDPAAKQFSVYYESGIQMVSSLSLHEYPFDLTPAELFESL
jgi:Uma2 family endonuclease